jgi:hypothetical protein
MRLRNTCPSCGATVSPDDLLCANCELILDVNQIPDRPHQSADFSVVRRMLETPQRGMPSELPARTFDPESQGDSEEGETTQIFALGNNTDVPIVVVSLTKRALSLSEFEAYVVSFIDGELDVTGLATKARIGEMEMGVVLQTLKHKMIVDFVNHQAVTANEASITADEEADEVDFQETTATTAPPPPPAMTAPAPPPPATAPSPPPVIRTHLVRPPPPPEMPEVRGAPRRAPALPPPPAVPEVVRAPDAVSPQPRRTLPASARLADTPYAPPLKLDSTPLPDALLPNGSSMSALASRDTAPPAAEAPSEALPVSPAGNESEPTKKPRENTDPRIINRGRVDRKVLDALKQVKRRDSGPSEVGPSGRLDEAPAENVADRLAAGSLQVAIRMEQSGRLEDAVKFLEHSIAKSPDAPSLYNRLAIILMRERGDLRRAEQMIQKALKLAPDNEVYDKNLKAVLSKLAMQKK